MTCKQLRFVQEYLVDLNGAAAARRAGYSTAGAKHAAWRLLRIPEVQNLGKEEMGKRTARVQVKQDEVVRELKSIAFAEASDESGAAVKCASKLRALEMLGRHMGMFEGRPQAVAAVRIVEDV